METRGRKPKNPISEDDKSLILQCLEEKEAMRLRRDFHLAEAARIAGEIKQFTEASLAEKFLCSPAQITRLSSKTIN